MDRKLLLGNNGNKIQVNIYLECILLIKCRKVYLKKSACRGWKEVWDFEIYIWLVMLAKQGLEQSYE